MYSSATIRSCVDDEFLKKESDKEDGCTCILRQPSGVALMMNSSKKNQTPGTFQLGSFVQN